MLTKWLNCRNYGIQAIIVHGTLPRFIVLSLSWNNLPP
jgi:hypothetical protein